MSVLTIRNGAFVPGVTQNITTVGGNQTSSLFGQNTSIIRVSTQVDIYVQLGTSASPTTASSSTSMLILAGNTELLSVQAAVVSSTGVVTQQSRIANLQAGVNAGVVSITQLTGYSN